MRPKFDRVCDGYKFLGNYYGYDVCIKDNMITARWGSNSGQYEICNIEILMNHCSSGFVDRSFSEKRFWYVAMLAALETMKKFKHNCDSCKFLGTFENHDVYICGNSVVARYGDKCHEYASMKAESLFKEFLKNPFEDLQKDIEYKMKWKIAMIAALVNLKVRELNGKDTSK